MARPKNPLTLLQSAATGAIKHPIGTAGKVVGTALGTAAAGRSVAGHLSRAAVGKAVETAGAVVSRGTGHSTAPSAASEPSAPAAPSKPVPTPAPSNGAGAQTRAPAKKAAEQVVKKAATPKPAAKKAPAQKAPATKAPATKAPATKAPAKKAAAKKTPAKKAPAKKTTKKVSDTPTPADVADVVAKKTAPASARRVPDVEERPDVTTPVGTTAADVATNPDTSDTDLQQPGTEPLVDPGTAKSLRSEAQTMRRAAETGDEQAAEDS